MAKNKKPRNKLHEVMTSEPMQKAGKATAKALHTYATKIKPATEKILDTAIKGSIAYAVGRRLPHSAKGALLGAIKGFFQHPEWYTKYPSDAVVALGYGEQYNTAFPFQEPRVRLNNPVSNSYINYDDTTYVEGVPSLVSVTLMDSMPGGDNSGWKNGLNYLFNTLTSANTAYTGVYGIGDIEAYVHNTIMLHINHAWLCRLYALAFSFDPSDAAKPAMYFLPNNVKYDEFRAHLAEVPNIIETLGNFIMANCPLNNALITRKHYLYTNVFTEDNIKDKEVYMFVPKTVLSTQQLYVQARGDFFLFQAPGETSGTYRPEEFSISIGPDGGFKTYVDSLLSVMDKMASTSAFAGIRRDMYKVFGPEATYQLRTPEFGESIVPISDPALLRQLANAKSPMFTRMSFTNNTFGEENIQYITFPTMPSSGFSGTASTPRMFTEFTTPSVFTATEAMPAEDNNISEQFHNLYNKYLILNTDKDTMSNGDTMSLLRFVGAIGDGLDNWVTDEQANTTRITWDVFGTETVTGVHIVTAADRLSGATDPAKYPCAGNIIWMVETSGSDVATNRNNMRRYLVMKGYVDAMRENFTYLPMYVALEGHMLDPTSVLWCMHVPSLDYENFGITTARSISSFNAYANMSLLRPNSSVVDQKKWHDYFNY